MNNLRQVFGLSEAAYEDKEKQRNWYTINNTISWVGIIVVVTIIGVLIL